MIKDRLFALIFRAAAFVIVLAGLLDTVGVFSGEFTPVSFFYYTIQSNILILGLFGYLTIKTAIAYKKDGRRGETGFNSRLSAMFLVAIMLTFCVFWAMLMPAYITEGRTAELWTFANLGVHFITPLLMLADYIMFSKGRALKRTDPFLFAIIPVIYLILATIFGLTGASVFPTIDVDGVKTGSTRFPYFFMDYDLTGWMCAFWIVLLSVVYIGASFALYLIDKRRK
ncbi:MAG: hypothetical protein LBM01_04205 [Christensenellaceae bacterium]|jgi:uncharacterized membrane protein YiaA|nr:hypothetical protein [Christensenellaceae bacterium]